MDEDFDGLMILGFGFELSINDVFSSRIRCDVGLDDFALMVKG